MIASLEGTLEYRGVDSVIVNVGGIGFQVYVSGSTLNQLGAVKDRVSLCTHLHLREDNASLYGFATSEELALFRNLISVSGVGPKLALALLSSLSPEQLVMAITSGNIDVISQVSGVGKRMASRLVVELRGKLEKQWEGTILPLASEDTDAVAALTSLGYSLRESSQAIFSIPDQEGMSLEEKVKAALQQLAAR
jgi:Holliday junction DNA helicase RuvA